MTRELHCVGMMGPSGYSQVTRYGNIFRVYHGRTPDSVTLKYTSSDQQLAHDVARKSAFRPRVQTLAYAQAVRS